MKSLVSLVSILLLGLSISFVSFGTKEIKPIEYDLPVDKVVHYLPAKDEDVEKWLKNI